KLSGVSPCGERAFVILPWLHRETARSFGGAGSTAGYEQVTAYTLTGQLQSRHLNLPQLDCDYDWNDNGQLIRISGPQE
ncbi:hypothetical protein, partial [Escherichia coli]